MTDHDFQQRTTDVLARLDTKMTIMVGEDGTGGWKAETDGRLKSLENDRERRRGRSVWLKWAAALTSGGGLTALAQKIFGGHH